MPPKVKVGTKGQKQIVEENRDTLNFYLYVTGGVNTVYFLVTFFFFWESFTTWFQFLVLCAIFTYMGAYKFMASMAKATYDPSSGALLDGGIDLNMEQGMAEHMKDLILLTSIIQCCTLISNYFWIFWLLAPGRAFYLLWVNILSPWFFAEAPEVDEKKQKKMERKMKRQQQQR